MMNFCILFLNVRDGILIFSVQQHEAAGKNWLWTLPDQI